MRITIVLLAVLSLVLIACVPDQIGPTKSSESSPDEVELSNSLDEFDDLDQLTAELEEISFDELDDVELE
jgi:ABC-type oligopeptide transport system substrate-binding subunit